MSGFQVTREMDPKHPRWFRLPKVGAVWHYGTVRAWSYRAQSGGPKRFRAICDNWVLPSQGGWRKPVEYRKEPPPAGDGACRVCVERYASVPRPGWLARLVGR